MRIVTVNFLRLTYRHLACTWQIVRRTPPGGATDSRLTMRVRYVWWRRKPDFRPTFPLLSASPVPVIGEWKCTRANKRSDDRVRNDAAMLSLRSGSRPNADQGLAVFGLISSSRLEDAVRNVPIGVGTSKMLNVSRFGRPPTARRGLGGGEERRRRC